MADAPAPATTAGPPPALPGVVHRYVGIPGIVLHAAEAGPADAPTIVLLHGWPQNWWIWREVIPVLADAGWHVLAVDLRGCGWSEAPARDMRKATMAADVAHLLDALGIDRFHLAGHDWGGWVAQLAAVEHPDRVQALTVLNIAALWTEPRVFLRHLPRFLYQPMVATPGLGPAAQRSDLFWWRMRGEGIPAEAVPVYQATLRDPAHARAGSRIYRDFLLRESRPSLAEARATARIEAPVSVLLAEDDPVIKEPMVEGLRSHAPSVELRLVPRCGHFIVDEQPTLVAEHLVAFHGAHRS